VISGVNLKIQSGDFMAMIGPNGGGKTTLLKLMLGLLKADSGSIRIFGKPPKEVSYRIGYVPQDIHINVVSHDLMVISRYVKSVACVNQRLHYHGHAELNGEMIEMMYDCKIEETCPVELIAHGLPHRVLHKHGDS